ncbi:hypothetical protein MPSEU_000289500 [Mayamaea pseudoterrestris]|nr:hypothetical protein MPSEU_000289500 [Mayamaea pseudoterrestris]
MFTLLTLSGRVSRDVSSIIRTAFRSVSSRSATTSSSSSSPLQQHSIDRADMPFIHHGQRPRFREKPKFKSPRKRASGLYTDLIKESMQSVRASRPSVFGTNVRVGDAIEIEQVAKGGINSTDLEKIRGVVLGIFNKKLDTTVLIRDVLFGFPVERRVPLYSPLVKSVKVLEENFVFKGKRKVKRAKLYYLRDRNPIVTRVTKW